MTDKQNELMKKAKAIVEILVSLDNDDRNSVVSIATQLMAAEDRVRMANAPAASIGTIGEKIAAAATNQNVQRFGGNSEG